MIDENNHLDCSLELINDYLISKEKQMEKEEEGNDDHNHDEGGFLR